MPSYTFNTDDLRRGFGVVKSVKPENSDYIIKFIANRILISSSDKIRFASSSIDSINVEDLDDCYESSGFFLSSEKLSLFDSKWDAIKINVNEKSITINTDGDGQIRKAYLKNRIIDSKINQISVPKSGGVFIDASLFDRVLYFSSCSATAKDKSDEDRKINQIHFYSDSNSVFSNARSHATIVNNKCLSGLDLSISAHDVSAIRSFCSKLKNSIIGIYSDSNRIYLHEEKTESVLSFPRIMIKKPDIFLFDSNLYSVNLTLNLEFIKDSVSWSDLVLEGSQRLKISSNGDNIKFIDSLNNELSVIPVNLISGNFDAEFPAKVLLNLLNFFDPGDVIMKYGYQEMPSLLELTQSIAVGNEIIQVSHFLQSMKRRNHGYLK